MPSDIEKEIHRIQKSTRTLIRHFSPLHNFLRMKFRWYYKWHLHPYHRHVHYSTLAVFSGAVISLMILFASSTPQKIHATGSTISVSDASTATVVNTGNKIYFDSVVYHANATIDNYSRQMAGYGWSADLGWIDFGSGADNPQGPVLADKNGLLSGKAKAQNGGYIDFNPSPNPANVTITAGVFAGYAWSDELGWINFSGVTVPGYNPDLLVPNNPSVAGKSTASGTALTNNTWYNYSHPYFSWTAPIDNADTITPSGVAGYYLYFGDSSSADPEVTSGVIESSGSAVHYQTGLNATVAGTLVNGTTYYLRVKTRDVAGNISNAATVFTYKYDSAVPTPPDSLSVSPKKITSVNNFTFSWGNASDPGASADPATGSDIKNYLYKVNDGEWQQTSSGETSAKSVVLTDISPIKTGTNTFYLSSQDNALNISEQIVIINFEFGATAPDAPTSLEVSPTTDASSPASNNSFRFSWIAPEHYADIAGYHYSVNAEPTADNTNTTTATATTTDRYATLIGKNTFYVVAEDIAGNIDYTKYAKIDFYCTSAVPGIPGNVQTFDASDRNTKEYAATVRWTKPTLVDDNFAGYDVYRSSDKGKTYAIAGTVTNVNNTIYSETNLESKEYFYYVKSRDSLDQASAASSSSSITPTGRFTTPPKLVSGPTTEVKPTSMIVRWATDRACSSFVQIKEGNSFVSEQGQTEQTTNHEVKVVGLRSLKDYVYTIRSTDIDGNVLVSDDLKFTTANTPSVYDFNISNITQNSSIINFKSTAVANFTLYYGETANYGSILNESSSSSTTNHSIALSSLKPGQVYFFRVVGSDADGNELRSENSFTTLPMPAISKFGIQPDKNAPSTTLKISWQTNVPTTSIVKYSTDGVKYNEKSNSDLTLDHEIVLTDLLDQSKYTIYSSGRDQFGNVCESDKNGFDTPTDTRAPMISDIIIEASNVGNSTDKAQVAISWKTDEPANSQIEYAIGLSGEEYTRKTSLDGTFTNHHLVIISDLDPGKPYHLRILSADTAGNLSKSGDNTVISGEISRSALQIILNTMQNLFGWMGKLIK